MKKLILLLWVLCLLACEDESFPTKNPKVDVFVAALVEGSYERDYLDPLPNFREQDIPALLFYANDFREIEYFPVNPISSFAPPTFRLGECMLWMIEAIRTSTDVHTSQLMFPSLVPVLTKKNPQNEVDVSLNEEELQEAHTLYKNWWETHLDQDFSIVKMINPLDGSPFQWR